MKCGHLTECVESQINGEKVKTCVNNIKNCIASSDKRSNVKCEERKKKYILENTNKNHVILYKMDGGIISLDKSVDAGLCKCDYLFVLNAAARDAVLVELKGVDVAHSLKQINGTLEQFKDFFKTTAHVYGRVVVTSSTPNLKTSPSYVNLRKKLEKEFQGNLKIAEKQLTEKDVDLAEN